jgi:hypothetical protein
MNAVPLALKLNRQPFADSSASGVIDGDAVLEFGDAPAFGMKRGGKYRRAKKKQITRTETQDLPPASLKFHSDWFAVGGFHLEELPLLESEHAGQNVGGERLDLRIKVAYHGVVVAPRVLDGILSLA